MNNSIKNRIIRLLKAFFACIVIFAVSFDFSMAAHLYFSPSSGEYVPGDSFVVSINLENEIGEECVNAIEAYIKFPQNRLIVSNFSIGESLISLWIQKPKIDNDNGTISFIGGVPGGYCGKVAGDPGSSNMLGRIIFKAPGFSVGIKDDSSPEEGIKIYFEEGTRALLNDGEGTQASLTMDIASFSVSKVASRQATNEWNAIVKSDAEPPEPFTVEIRKEKDVFEGKFFIVFNAIDKQTGIDHYEIMESDRGGYKVNSQNKAPWIIVQNGPYLLTDQTLQSVIKVKAMDKAGNERTVEYEAPQNIRPPVVVKKTLSRNYIYGGVIFGLILLVLLLIFVYKKLMKKNSNLTDKNLPEDDGNKEEVENKEENRSIANDNLTSEEAPESEKDKNKLR